MNTPAQTAARRIARQAEERAGDAACAARRAAEQGNASAALEHAARALLAAVDARRAAPRSAAARYAAQSAASAACLSAGIIDLHPDASARSFRMAVEQHPTHPEIAAWTAQAERAEKTALDAARIAAAVQVEIAKIARR